MLYTDKKCSAIRRWPSEVSKRWLEHYLNDVEIDPQILAVIAVGSSVRDVSRSNDIDLVSITSADPNIYKLLPPLEIDLRVYSANGLEDKIKRGNDYLGWAVKYGKILHEKDEYWTKLVLALESKVPMPSSTIARERAAIAEENVRKLLKIGDDDAALEQLVSFLTHVARAVLIEAGVYPTSRPELPEQLREVGRYVLAGLLTEALEAALSPGTIYSKVQSNPKSVLK